MSPAYRIACLCDLRDEQGRILVIQRRFAPNAGLWSPIGGKIKPGESPAMGAQREIREEAGIDVRIERLRLAVLWSERGGSEGDGDDGPAPSDHWLMFIYQVVGPVSVCEGETAEGPLRWVTTEELAGLPVPRTDREILWPMFAGLDPASGPAGVHVDWTSGAMRWERM